MAKTKLFPSPQQRLLPLQRTRRALQSELDGLENTIAAQQAKKLAAYGAKLDRDLMKSAFAACDKADYAQHQLEEKLFGVFPHHKDYKRAILLRGFDDEFYAPHSRHTTVSRGDIEATAGLKILASSPQAGVYAVMNKEGRQIFVTGHSEYDPETLKNEYLRDKNLGLNIHVPENYFPDDDDTQEPIVRWRGHANLLFSNWLNYFVYQTTPYDIMTIGQE